MFIKVLKHDFRITWKTFMGLFMGLFAAMLIVSLTNLIPAFEFFPVDILRQIVTILGVLIVAIASYLQILLLFQRNFFGAEGYLMLTLPVSRGKLLASKLITTQLWFNFMMLLVPIMAVLLYPPTNSTIWEAFVNALTPSTFIAIVTINVVAFVGITFLYLTITLSNSVFFGKKVHGIIAGVFAAVIHFVFFWGFNAIRSRFIEEVPIFYERPEFSNWIFNIPQVGFRYGRIAPESWQEPDWNFPLYIDIWQLGLGLAVGAAAIALTMYLLKKRTALR